MLTNVPENCMNQRSQLVTTDNKVITFILNDTKYLTSLSFLGGYIYTKDYNRSDCTSNQEFIPITCLNQWTRLYLIAGGWIWFYPTDKNYETSMGYIWGWVYAPNFNSLSCSIYESEWNSSYGTLKLKRVGNQVSGNYYDGRAPIENGMLTGDVLQGKWIEGSSSGKFKFIFTDNRTKFNGTWGYGESESGGYWNGIRISGEL